MHPNEELVTNFYESLRRKDADGISACYHPQAYYHDPVFEELPRERAMAMWRMVCSLGDGLTVRYCDVWADDERGGGRWEALYAFSRTGRQVHNRITSRFLFRDGLIAEHQDSFGVYRWASMALGFTGKIAGWSPPVRTAIRRQAGKSLDAFITGTSSP